MCARADAWLCVRWCVAIDIEISSPAYRQSIICFACLHIMQILCNHQQVTSRCLHSGWHSPSPYSPYGRQWFRQPPRTDGALLKQPCSAVQGWCRNSNQEGDSIMKDPHACISSEIAATNMLIQWRHYEDATFTWKRHMEYGLVYKLLVSMLNLWFSMSNEHTSRSLFTWYKNYMYRKRKTENKIAQPFR